MSLVQKLLKYNVSRPIIVTPFWNWTFIIVTIIWVLLMFVLNIATSAYDLVPVLSPSYESTYRLWYQQIFPQTSWTPESWTCDPSFINILEGRPCIVSIIYVRCVHRSPWLFYLQVYRVS